MVLMSMRGLLTIETLEGTLMKQDLKRTLPSVFDSVVSTFVLDNKVQWYECFLKGSHRLNRNITIFPCFLGPDLNAPDLTRSAIGSQAEKKNISAKCYFIS